MICGPDIVLEVSGNHGGSLDNCLRLIDEAKTLKPAFIKFQCYDPDRLAQQRRDNREVANAIKARDASSEERYMKLLHLYMRTFTPRQWWPHLLRRLDGYPWSSSVFSFEDLTFLQSQHCPAYKVASFELQNTSLIEACANTGKPLTISVNAAATAQHVLAATNAAGAAEQITVLHASAYSTKAFTDYENLQREKARYSWLCTVVPAHVRLGLSDHSPPTEFDLSDWAIRKDADMIERHLRLADVNTPDAKFSSTARQLGKYMGRVGKNATAVRKLETAAG